MGQILIYSGAEIFEGSASSRSKGSRRTKSINESNMELNIEQLSLFLDQLSNAGPASYEHINTYLAQLDSLDYDSVESVLDRVQSPSAAFMAASAMQRKLERATFSGVDVIPYQRRILGKLGRFITDAPLAAQKIISIDALLAIHALPNGANPIKIFAFLLNGGNYIPPEDDTVTPFDYALLNSHDIQIIIAFAISLIEQVPKVKFSREEQHHPSLVQAKVFRMKTVRPLREASDDIAWIIKTILQHNPWNIPAVQKSLQCYRAWVEYAVVSEEVNAQVLFPNLSEIFDHDIRKFFMNKETIKVSAEAFNDIAEWSALSKAGTNEIFDLLTSTDIIQQSTTLDYDVFSALASLTITLCESVVEKITDPLTTRNTKALEIMLLLLNSDVSSRTFNFWLCFAETSMDIADGHQGDPWLERALPILLQRSAWRDGDPDEWSAYRMDVVEVFETVCDVLGNDKINSFVFGWLSSSLGDGDVDQRMIIMEATLFFVLSVKSEFTLDKGVQESLFHQIFEILDNTSLRSEAEVLLQKTVLHFFVPYSKSLEIYDLSRRAYSICLVACRIPKLSSAAACALNKIVKTLRIEELPIDELIEDLHILLLNDIDIVEKLIALEGYIFLFASRLDKEIIPGVISSILRPMLSIDVQHCDSIGALNVLKIVFAIGKTLYTTAPGKLDADSWIHGEGRKMMEGVRFLVKMFVNRFGEEFEVMEIVTEMLQFATSNGGGLLLFSVDEITYLINEYLNSNNPITSNASTLIISLAAFLTKFYSSKSRPDISDQVCSLLSHFTALLLPGLEIPQFDQFPRDMMDHSIALRIRQLLAQNPELFFEVFDFLVQSMPRYSTVWDQHLISIWMTCMLTALGIPEGGMSFQGAVDFFMALIHRVSGQQPPEMVRNTFEYFREAIFAQVIKTISSPAPSNALPNLSSLLRALLRTNPAYPRMWLDLLERYVTKGPEPDRQKFSRSAMRYLGDKAMLEVVKEWWTACH